MIKLDWANRRKVEYKRYLLFSYGRYYPAGGAGDLEATSDNIHELKHYAYESEYEFHEILDLEERKWINPQSI